MNERSTLSIAEALTSGDVKLDWSEWMVIGGETTQLVRDGKIQRHDLVGYRFREISIIDIITSINQKTGEIFTMGGSVNRLDKSIKSVRFARINGLIRST